MNRYWKMIATGLFEPYPQDENSLISGPCLILRGTKYRVRPSDAEGCLWFYYYNPESEYHMTQISAKELERVLGKIGEVVSIITIENILEDAPDDIREKLLFHLELFE